MEHSFAGHAVHDRHRGGADDPRCRHAASSSTRSRRCSSPRRAGEIKPELMESVLEISTDPCADATARPASSCGRCAAQVCATAAAKEMAIGSAGTHPFAMWEDQRIVARPRYRDLISALRFVARQELIFGMHVHVGVDDPDKAIHVANGMRVHLPVLLGLSANSPFWRAAATGLASTRTPIFRAFPRVGIPPTYARLGRLRAADRVHDRSRGDRGLHLPVARRPPAPEVRDRRDPGDGLPDPHRAHGRAGGARAGAGQGAVRALRRRPAAVGATRSRCSTRTSGWPPATASTASSSTCPSSDRVATRDARPPAARPDARALPGPRLGGRARGRRGPAGRGATAPPARSSSTRPITTCTRSMAEIVAATDGLKRRRSKPPSTRRRAAPVLQSPREHRRPGPVRGLQELRIRGQPVHHRVPVLRQPAAQAGAEARPRRSARRSAKPRRTPAPLLGRLRRGEIPGIRADRRAVRDDRAGRAGAGRLPAVADRRRRHDLGPDHRRQARHPVVAAVHGGVHLRQHRLRVRRRCSRSRCSAGCSSAATARWWCSPCSCSAGSAALAATAARVARFRSCSAPPGRRSR